MTDEITQAFIKEWRSSVTGDWQDEFEELLTRATNQARANERSKVLAEVEEFINQEQEVLINRGSDGKDKWTPTKIKLSTIGVAELRAKLAEMKEGK